MSSRIDQLELALRQVAETVRGLEGRVAELERRGAPVEVAELWPGPAVSREAGRGRLASLVPLVGRTLLILGGAFLLRAVTELEATPNAVGLLLGFLYAMAWLFAAYRSAAGPEGRLGAAFHAAVSAVIAYPLVLEAATRFGLLEQRGAAVAVAVVSAALLWVAVRRRLATAAAAASVGGGLTLLALLRAAARPAPALIMLTALGLALFWLCRRQGWRLWPWPSALMADLAFAIVPAGIASGRFEIEPGLAVALQVGLFVAYGIAFAVPALAFSDEREGAATVGTFEIVQTLLAGVVAFGGAWKIAGADSVLAGLTALVLGVAAYGVAFSRAVRADRRRNFFYFTSLGLALIAVGSLGLLPAIRAALVWSVLGIACALASARFERVTLSLHCTLYLLAALLASGLARTATAGFWMPDPAAWPPIRWDHAVVIAALFAASVIPAARRSSSWDRLALVPRAALLLFGVWAAGGALLALLAPRYLGTGLELDAGALATSRTGLLAIAALLLAWLSRRPRFTEAAWLVYPLLALAGFRVLSQDLLEGRPVTLFVSLGLLGASLMASARWLKREEPASD